MKQQQISAVIVLLGQDEIKMFDPPLLDVYSADGFKPFHIPARAPGNFARIMAVMEQAAQDGSRVVVHCTGDCL
jgi:protein-tyrosine phosphatase